MTDFWGTCIISGLSLAYPSLSQRAFYLVGPTVESQHGSRDPCDSLLRTLGCARPSRDTTTTLSRWLQPGAYQQSSLKTTYAGSRGHSWQRLNAHLRCPPNWSIDSLSAHCSLFVALCPLSPWPSIVHFLRRRNTPTFLSICSRRPRLSQMAPSILMHGPYLHCNL